MSELAFNVNGEPFEVPAAATGWRVRKLKPKGAPEVVYGRDGVPLVLPIDAELDDLRRETGTPGRYRIDPVDDSHRPIPMAPAGYVFIHADERPGPIPPTPLPEPSDSVVIEAMRMNTELARSVVDRFPQMLEAAAILIRAADGAGLPARPGMVVEERGADEGDEGVAVDPTDSTALDLNSIIAQIVPIVIAGLGGKKLPKLASLLDWRKATPGHQPTQAAEADAEAQPSSKPSTNTSSKGGMELPPIDPSMMTHFIAVQSALSPEEGAMAREIAAELTPAELRAWFEELAALSVPDAVEKIRTFIAGEKGGRA